MGRVWEGVYPSVGTFWNFGYYTGFLCIIKFELTSTLAPKSLQMHMISVNEGVGETVSVVKWDTKGRPVGGGLGSHSSVASFLLLGGGGGGQDPQMYRQKKNKSCIKKLCNLYARASASEIYVFSGVQIHLHVLICNQCSGMAL